MMLTRQQLVLASVLFIACGGPTEPAAPAETAASSAATSASSAPVPDPTATADAAPPMTPGDPRVASTLKGSLLGKPFEAGSACINAAAEPGRGYLEIYDQAGNAQTSCAVLAKTPGARKIGMSIPWKRGVKVDLAALKAKSKNEPALFVMERVTEEKVERKDAGKDFKPTGSLEIVRTADQGGVARIKVSLVSGKDKLEGEVDVEVKGDIKAE